MLVKSHPFSEYDDSNWQLTNHRLVVAGPIVTEELIRKTFRVNKIYYLKNDQVIDDQEILCQCVLFNNRQFVTICLNIYGWWFCTEDLENKLVINRANYSAGDHWVYSDNDDSMIYEAGNAAEEIYIQMYKLEGFAVSKRIADQMFSLFGI